MIFTEGVALDITEGKLVSESNLGERQRANQEFGARAVPYANLTNPQTLNLYAIVSDNPETFADLDGHTCGSIGANDRNGCSKENSQTTNTGGNDPDPHKTGDSTQQSDAQKAAEGVVMLGEAAVNGVVAAGKMNAAAGLAATGIGTPAAIATAWSASGNVAAAGIQVVGAATGATDKASEAAKVATATSPTGIITLAMTRGNMQKAERNATYEAIVTANPRELLNGSAVSVVAKVIDYVQNVKDALFH